MTKHPEQEQGNVPNKALPRHALASVGRKLMWHLPAQDNCTESKNRLRRQEICHIKLQQSRAAIRKHTKFAMHCHATSVTISA
jgi:hypothetical protein